MSLKEKYTPKRISDYHWPNTSIETLALSIATGKVTQPQLFYGPPGRGKTILAEVVLRAIVGEDTPSYLDFHYIRAPDIGGTKVIKGLRDKLVHVDRDGNVTGYRPPMTYDKHLVLVDEVDKLSKQAQHALRTVLNQVPEDKAQFILTANDAGAVDKYIRSRCGGGSFVPDLPPMKMAAFVRHICESEGYKPTAKEVNHIVSRAAGDVRAIWTPISLLIG